MGNGKASSDESRTPKQSLYFGRCRVGCNIEVFRFFMTKQVTDATADQVRFKTSPLQGAYNFHCMSIKVTSIDDVVVYTLRQCADH